MKICLKGHNEEYAVMEMVNSFFPKIKLEFTSDADKNDDFIISEISKEGETYIYHAKAFINKAEESCTLYNNTYSKNTIKKSIYTILSKITKIHLPWGLMTGIRPAKLVRQFLENGDNSISAIEHLENEYLADNDKAKLAYEVEKTESELLKKAYKNGISLYVGIPFCPTRCLYCSFTSQSVAFSNRLVEPYVEALKYEIEKISELDFFKNKTIETIYFGGGTPSAIDSKYIDEILFSLYKYFDLSNLRELTFEAGRPDTITKEKLLVLKKYNISRISINPQTSSDKTLNLIGRNHTCDDFIKAFELARSLDFSHINCDIIAGLPNEDEEDFEKTVNLLSNLNPESMTVHTMSIKHGSYLDGKYSTFSPTGATVVNNMLNMASQSADDMGLHPYYMYRQKNMLGNLENVGYCKMGHECLYNIYIMEEVQTIVALGSGGSTKLIDGDRIDRVFNVKEVSEYIKRIDEMIDRKRGLLS